VTTPRFSPAVFLLAFCCAYAVAFEMDCPLFRYYPLHGDFSWGAGILKGVGPAMTWYGLVAGAGIVAVLAAALVCMTGRAPGRRRLDMNVALYFDGVRLASRLGRFASWWCAVVAASAMSIASAQYSFNPSNSDEQVPGIRYFGSAKDANGSLLPGVWFVFDTGSAMYAFVTDDLGRFRGQLPLATVPDKVSPKCRKAGFQVVHVTQRTGTLGPKPTVQVDCVLRADRESSRH